MRYSILALLLVGCDVVTTGDRLVHEDGSPANEVTMILSNEEYTGITETLRDGSFHFIAPKGIEVSLCAYPPWGEACYDGWLFTPPVDGGLLREKQ